MRDVQFSYPTLLVLKVFLERSEKELWGQDLIRSTTIASGTLYPLLDRLQRRRFLNARKERINTVKAGRPARRYYTLTKEGRKEARKVFARLRLRNRRK